MRPFYDESHLFVFEHDRWRNLCNKDYCIYEEPTITEVENGIVLPLKRRTDVAVSAFEGGVCDKNGKFVTGLYRNLNNLSANLSCARAYSVSKNTQIQVRNETVVFGGVLFAHFGHMITDGLARLWWLADHPNMPYKLIFLTNPAHGEFKLFNVLEALGIAEDRMEIISTPTQFNRIIVPEQTLYLLSNYRLGVEKIYDYLRHSVTPRSYPKVYLSRTRLQSGSKSLNEEYYESFYQRRGYKIVYPEQLTFPEQISIMAGADEVVALHGSLIHLTSFCKPQTHIVVLNRCQDIAGILPLLQGLRMNYDVIDAHFSFLPAKVAGIHTYLMGPTIYWRQYLDKAEIPYDENELSTDKHLKPFVLDYVMNWCANAMQHYKQFKNEKIIDILNRFNILFYQKQINKNAFPDRDDIVKLKQENNALKDQIAELRSIFKSAVMEQAQQDPTELQKNAIAAGLDCAIIQDETQIKELKTQVEQLKDEIKKIKESKSWRLTEPLRAIKALLKNLV